MAREIRSSSCRRLPLAALIAAITLSLALGAGYARGRIADIERDTFAHAQALARQFAALVAGEVQRGDHARLEATARAITRHYPAVRSVAVLDAEGRLLARADGRRPEANDVPDQDRRRIRQPIAVHPGDEPAYTPEPATVAPIGHFVATLDLAALGEHKRKVVWESAGLAGAMVLLTAVLGLLARSKGRRPLGTTLALPDRAARPLVAARLRSLGGLRAHELATAVAELQRDNERLNAARRAAEAESERKSRFLADLSHEIRTPMNAILGFTELLARDGRPARQRDHIATIRDSTRSLLDLLNGMLDLSKAEAGHLQLDYANLDLNALLGEMLQLFAPQAFAKGVELVVDPVPQDVTGVRADGMRLKQVLVNLLSNAIRFTDAGHIRLSAEPAERTDARVRICFTVADSGCGIDEAMQPRLFEAFTTQGRRPSPDPSTPALDPGTGLGLNIASELVGLMGSRIEFSSQAAAGSHFWFTLVLERAQRQKPPSSMPCAPYPRVALIDPDDVTRPHRLGMLERAGVRAEPMTESQWAAVAAPERYNAIVVHIPARDSASGAIAPPDPRLTRCGLPIIAWVYEPDSPQQTTLWHAGFRRVLGKSADPGSLREAFDAALSAIPTPPTEDRPHAPPGPTGRILVVDDDAVGLRLMSHFLADANVSACTVASSGEALRRAAHEPFDAILLDLHLPDGDGIATVERLRDSDGPNSRTPILALTADAQEEQADRALEAGIDDVLTKPIGQNDLLQRLHVRIAPATDESGDGPPVIDPRESLRRARANPELARELFQVLCRTLPQSRRALIRARLQGDRDAIRGESHRLRGAVIYCGVPRLEAAIADLGRTLRGDDPEALARVLAGAEREIAAVLAESERVDDPFSRAEAADAPPTEGSERSAAR